MIPRLLQSLATPHLLHPSHFDAIRAQLETIDAAVPTPEDFGNQDPAQYIVTDEVAHINIHGPLIHRATGWEKYFGCHCHLDLQAALQAAAADPYARAIVLSIDSPGGTVSGTAELAQAIDQVDVNTKPVLAHVGGLCASAAYWVASQCRHIYATPSSEVGSIGVYLPFFDTSRALEDAGVRVDIIKNGAATHKAAGYPGTSLTAEQREGMVEDIDEIFQTFAATIQHARGEIPTEAMTGRTYSAANSLAHNLVDYVGDLTSASIRALDEADKMPPPA